MSESPLSVTIAGDAAQAIEAIEHTVTALFRVHLYTPGARVETVGRLVRRCWLAGADHETERRYTFDVTYHAEAFHGSYIVAALLLLGANPGGYEAANHR